MALHLSSVEHLVRVGAEPTTGLPMVPAMVFRGLALSACRRIERMLIGMGSRRRSASQAIDLPSDGGVNLERLFTPKAGLSRNSGAPILPSAFREPVAAAEVECRLGAAPSSQSALLFDRLLVTPAALFRKRAGAAFRESRSNAWAVCLNSMPSSSP